MKEYAYENETEMKLERKVKGRPKKWEDGKRRITASKGSEGYTLYFVSPIITPCTFSGHNY